MADMRRAVGSDVPAGSEPKLTVDEARLAMMRRVKQLEVSERIALLDRTCREQTRIAIGTRRIR